MNIPQSSLNVKSSDNSTNVNTQNQPVKNDDGKNFADELKNVNNTKTTQDTQNAKTSQENKNNDDENSTSNIQNENREETVDDALSGLNDTIDELNKLNQKDELEAQALKQKALQDDINKRYEENALIENNLNIQEPQEKLNVQTSADMNFNNGEQPFADFVKQNDLKETLKSSAKELEEEKSIMSTMEENIAIANKNMALSKTKTVENEHGVQKIDKKSNLVVDTIVKYDNIIMDKSDVEFFANLTENGVLNISDVQGAEKSSRVSKALADLLVKAMNENKPIRIDFDNNISVIIKIDRAGKISADFLPSSQVAEAYLKENLPLLRQRFDENNIDYNELNQRQRKQENQDNRKKERKDE